MARSLSSIGDYCMFLWRSFTVPDKWREFFKRYLNEIYKLGIDSIPLIIIVSLFIGALCTILIKLNINNPLLPRYAVGLTTREIILLEFSSSILCLILSGKIGSNIASEIGTMRVTEQIDALDIMGVNSANFLVLPKVLGLITILPFLVVICMATSLFGGYIICVFTGVIDVDTYIYGIQTMFIEWYVWFALIKSLFFAFIISTISAYFGYTVEGGSVEVGKASTNAVVLSNIMILVTDVILTKLLLV
ncbi:MAG: ABC transporter permease [Muribaculaceae bacterium]|nr:ABC transporter permease [Muribaculaceae bacterium]MBQ1798499.1 ABC transporter permease [Muribaculaceae bacterium]MBQ4005507.1 ABC transporter permease [Muribaculaceae bacterium]